MTQLTKHVKDILRAITDGKQIEGRMCPGTWETVDNEHVLCCISKGGSSFLRIKPETRSINGKEFIAPVDRADFMFTPEMLEVFEGFTWTDCKDRDIAYKTIVDALEGKTK